MKPCHESFLTTIVLFGLLLLSTAAPAQVLVLVHGYLGDAASWDRGGVMPVLEARGWRRGSRLPAPQGIASENTVYAISLPATAPIKVQTRALIPLLRAVADRHAGESLSLAGHSAGGVVARMALLHPNCPPVETLITIAAPHLGTHRAEQALDLATIPFPFSLPVDWLGGPEVDALRHSRGLLWDLIRPRPGTLLFWLNAQPHPAIRYVAILRGGPVGLGDWVVPGFSQDLNRVPALAGRAEVLWVPARHDLVPADGLAIADILERR